MNDELTVEYEEWSPGQGFYSVGGWTFENEDMDLNYIDGALAAWTAWRKFVEVKIAEAGQGAE